ncbi:hypothetical protein ACFOU0_12260 [Salinicoccus sesuvii]|uniref:Replicase n=1 Tax=Salinicoccus sesuvii TaxID=868281 RepID=A0ABV7N6X1_9STAP
MKIFQGSRSSGKTAKAIRESSKTGCYILVRSSQEATEIFQMANRLNLRIPYPVTVDELSRESFKGTSLERDGVIVDNALSVLEEMLAVKVNLATIDYGEESE